MDQTINPCDDFYEFACGNFLKKTVIENDDPLESTFTAIENSLINKLRIIVKEPIQSDEQKPFKMTKLLYKSCMDEGNI